MTSSPSDNSQPQNAAEPQSKRIPARVRRRYAAYCVALGALLMTGYALSIGPVAYYSCKLNLGVSRYSYIIEPSVGKGNSIYVMEGSAVSNPHPMVENIYLPLMLFCTYVPYADNAMNSYLGLWDKTFHIEKKA